MKWTCWIAALFLCCGTVNANAGLFGGLGKHGGCHDDSCCPTCAAPAECCPDPSCCAPAECCPAEPTCCAPAEPTCCAPAHCGPAECCPAEPTCCAPAESACCVPSDCAPACDDGCTSHSHCKPKRKGCLSRLFGIFKKNRHSCHSSSSCCEENCCPEPSCCAPVEPACCAPSGCH